MTLTPAQRMALRGMASPVLLCRHDSHDAFSGEPFVCWFLYAPQEYSRPDFWTLYPEEGQALVDGGLVEGQEVIDLSGSVVTTYRITDAGRASVNGKLKTPRKRRVLISTENENEQCIEQKQPVLRGAGGGGTHAGSGQGNLPDLDAV